MKPFVFWSSSPVKPDETLLLSGEDFEPDAALELSYKGKTHLITPLQTSPQSMKAVIPAGISFGAYECTVVNGSEKSDVFYVNKPDIWWCQGDGGLNVAFNGSWLRIFGVALSLDGVSTRVYLDNIEPDAVEPDGIEPDAVEPDGIEPDAVEPDGIEPDAVEPDNIEHDNVELEVTEQTMWAVSAVTPEAIAAGVHTLTVDNGGMKTSVTLEIKAKPDSGLPVFRFNGDRTGVADCSQELLKITGEAAKSGGVICFPHGRYRLDFTGSYTVPENVVLRGEGMNLTSLWWSKNGLPVPDYLIKGRDNFGIEDIAIYAQGPLKGVIYGENNVVINRVMIRANPYYMSGPLTKAKASDIDRAILEGYERSGHGVHLHGCNNRVLSCDILAGMPFNLEICSGNVVSGNKYVSLGQAYGIYGSDMIFENNSYSNGMLGSGGNIAHHFNKNCTREHVYFKGNTFKNMYCGDHEMITFDGHGAVYNGKLSSVGGTEMKLISDRIPYGGYNRTESGAEGLWAFIIDGRGAGQYQRICGYSEETKTVRLEKPWKCEPDLNSVCR